MSVRAEKNRKDEKCRTLVVQIRRELPELLQERNIHEPHIKNTLAAFEDLLKRTIEVKSTNAPRAVLKGALALGTVASIRQSRNRYRTDKVAVTYRSLSEGAEPPILTRLRKRKEKMLDNFSDVENSDVIDEPRVIIQVLPANVQIPHKLFIENQKLENDIAMLDLEINMLLLEQDQLKLKLEAAQSLQAEMRKPKTGQNPQIRCNNVIQQQDSTNLKA